MNTTRKVSVFGVILVRIQSKCEKMRTRITPNTDTIYTVQVGQDICKTSSKHNVTTKMKDVYKKSTRHLYQDECLLGQKMLNDSKTTWLLQSMIFTK